MIALEIAGLDLWLALVAITIVLAGSALQASIGIGLGLLAAPTLGLIDPAFVPGALAVCVVPLTFGMALRERGHVDRTGLVTAVPGRFVGAVFGAALVAVSGQRAIVLVVGISVLLAVVASATGIRFAPSRRNIGIAGVASGFSGTVAAIGGPPMALTYQHGDPRTLRSTLAVFNTIGSMFTIPGLVIAGAIGRRQVEYALLLAPAVVAGLWIGRYTIARLHPDRIRPVVLATCAASALTLLVREVL